MVHSIAMTNFRGVTNGTVTGFKPLTILVGPNNSGKSTVLEALEIVIPQQINLNAVVQERDRFARNWRYLLPFGKSAHATISAILDGGQAAIQFNADPSGTVNPPQGKQGPSMPLAFVGLNRERWPDSTASYDSVLAQGSDVLDRLEALVRRALPGVSRIVTSEEPGTNQRGLKLVMRPGSIPFELAADGLKRLFLVAAQAAGLSNGALLLVEEPECFQHPGSLDLMAPVLVGAVSSGVQVVCTTHSLELIDAVIRAALAPPSVDRRPMGVESLAVLRLKLDQGVLSNIVFAGPKVQTMRDAAEFDLR